MTYENIYLRKINYKITIEDRLRDHRTMSKIVILTIRNQELTIIRWTIFQRTVYTISVTTIWINKTFSIAFTAIAVVVATTISTVFSFAYSICRWRTAFLNALYQSVNWNAAKSTFWSWNRTKWIVYFIVITKFLINISLL